MSLEMKAIVKAKPSEGLEIQHVPFPTIGPQDVLVRVKAMSICGSDLHIYNWDEWASHRMHLPTVVGHEFSGEVVEVGDEVESVRIGDFVSAESHISCGLCVPCRTGNSHVCINTSILGIDRNGCFAEYVSLPERNVWKNDPSLSPILASIQEPLGNAVHSVLADEIAGKTVLVLGCGTMGCFAIGVARVCGASFIIGVDVNEYRLNLAKKMKADALINETTSNLVEGVMDLTLGVGVDVVLEMSGAPSAIKKGFKALRPGGRVSLLGLPLREVEIDLTNDIIFKGVKVYGITGRKLYETWYQVSRLLTSRVLDVTPVITHIFKFDEFEKGMELMRSGNCLKVVLMNRYIPGQERVSHVH
ncbi:MAG: L-threonine 3-dehydrogenase [Thermodesulfobacteriota bacterium]